MGCALSRDSQRQQLPGMGTPVATGGPPRCKMVLLGDSGVGKSCLVQRQCRGTFNPSNALTVGAAFVAHTLVLPTGRHVKMDIWDTAGQERYESLAPLYYRGANAAAIVFDLSSTRSFVRAKHWVAELRRNTAGAPLLVLVGNKSDLPDEERQVSGEDARQLAESNGMVVIETSAKTGANVAQLFLIIGEHIAATPPAAPQAITTR